MDGTCLNAEVSLAHWEPRSQINEHDKVWGHPLEDVEVGLAHCEGQSQTAERDRALLQGAPALRVEHTLLTGEACLQSHPFACLLCE